jgi:hypothetical protein
MTSLNETLKTIKLTNTLYASQIQSLTVNLQDGINQIIQKTQLDLINSIAQDYNISIRELTKKYVSKPKKIRKTKESLDDDSPTLQTINESKNYYLSDEDNDMSNIVINQNNVDSNEIIGETSQAKKTRKPRAKKNVVEEIDNDPESIENEEDVYKSITIKNTQYLLDPNTNKIYDMDNKLVGTKKDNKYYLKNTNTD